MIDLNFSPFGSIYLIFQLDKSRITFMFSKSTDVSYKIWIILNNSLDFATDVKGLLGSNTLPDRLQKLANDAEQRIMFDEIVRCVR